MKFLVDRKLETIWKKKVPQSFPCLLKKSKNFVKLENTESNSIYSFDLWQKLQKQANIIIMRRGEQADFAFIRNKFLRQACFTETHIFCKSLFQNFHTPYAP